MKETKIKIGNVRQMTDEDIVDIGYRIREARKKAGMSQRELAEYFAISRDHMCRIEKGKRVCKTEFLFEIAQLFGVSVDYLLFG